MSLRIGSLFSGIGGLEMGLEWAGLGHVVWQVEQDSFCREVLARHWPGARRYEDVRSVGAATLSPVDVLCGGFPCQDISAANHAGRGLDGKRSSLWFEYLRLIDELKPRVVIIENVARLVRRGLDTVVAGLDGLGFTVEGTRIRAGDVGAPHRRERLFLVAYTNRPELREQSRGFRGSDGTGAPVAVRRGEEVGNAADGAGRHTRRGMGPSGAGEWAFEPRVGGVTYGFPARMDFARWPLGLGARQHAWEAERTVAPRSVPNRSARVKALGNAVVPHCAYIVGLRAREVLDNHNGHT
jgi:DNA (cytosine-5)-methyltransferase 1